MSFHRYSAPSYFGGLPAGYDYINDPVTNGDAGVAAFADGKRGSGVNAGTYFIAFGEDATSSDLNRPAKALAQNTDALDDLLRRDLAITARTADVTAGSPVSSVVIAGQIYVGDFGVSNTQAQRDALISVLDSNDNELLVGATKVQALLIHDGSSTNVVGTQTSGFYSTITVNFNVAIPAGTTYHVYYGVRSNLATLPKDAFTSIKIRSAQEVEAAVEQLFRDLHSTAAGTNWNDPWTATVNSLARTGLDGRYRLSSTDPGASPALNTPGNGGTITRDGPAPAISFPTYDLTAVGTIGTSRYPDAAMAGWRFKRASPIVATGYDTKLGGDVGAYQESPFHNFTDAAEVAYSHVAGPLVMDVTPRSITASTLASFTVNTRINAAAVGSVNASAGSDATSRRTITLASGDYIRAASGRSAFRKSDLLEVTDNATGLVVGVYKLDAVLSDTTFTVKTVTGAIPPLGPSGASAAARFRWLQPLVSIGGQNRVGAADSNGLSSLFVAQAGVLTDGFDSEHVSIAAIMLSALCQRDIGATAETLFTAMAWGGFNMNGDYVLRGKLLGDGGYTTTGGRQGVNQLSRRTTTHVMPNGGTSTATLNPVIDGMSLLICPTAAVTTPTTTTVTISTAGGYVVQDGDEFDATVVVRNGTTAAVAITWPGNFVFSGVDGVIPVTNASGADYVIQYRFNYKAGVPTPGWYATRTDY